MNVVFMGTAPFAVPCLRAVLLQGHSVAAVVTQPDRPAGRGQAARLSPVKSAALAAALPVLQPERASQPEFIASLSALVPDLIVVVAYGQILKQSVLDIPPVGCINVHGSLLPALRGAAPIQWAVIRGLAETGVTTMFMDAGMDTGDIILSATEQLTEEDTAGSLSGRLAPIGADLLSRTLDLLAHGRAPRTPQDSAAASYAPMLKREDGFIDWSRSAASIRNLIHGCNPAPAALTMRNGKQVKLWRARVVGDPVSPATAPGTVLHQAAGGPVVATGEGMLQLLELQPESRPRMGGEDYCRGYHLQPADQFNRTMGDD